MSNTIHFKKYDYKKKTNQNHLLILMSILLKTNQKTKEQLLKVILTGNQRKSVTQFGRLLKQLVVTFTQHFKRKKFQSIIYLIVTKMQYKIFPNCDDLIINKANKMLLNVILDAENCFV